MTSRGLFLKLNNYDYSDEHIEVVKQYLINGTFPPKLKDSEKTHIKVQYKDFGVKDNQIYYKPLDLLVVPNSNKQELLKETYDNPLYGLGAGIKSFYNKIIGKYLGITRKDVDDFLKTQQYYQLTKAAPRVVNRPIIAKYPNHRWAADLVDMGYYAADNRNFKWILTIIDFFTKKVFAYALKNKEAETIRNGFEQICSSVNTYPLILQTDNGGEFVNEILRDWATDHNVKLVRTLSYSPTSNGLIENFNNLLRKMIREGFIRNNNFNWVDHLDTYVLNRNGSKHSTTKFTPNDIWAAGREPLDKLSKKEKKALRENDNIIADYDDEGNQLPEDEVLPTKLNKVLLRLEDKAAKMLDKETESYELNEPVRVLMTALHSKIRSLEKSGNSKLIVVKYSPKIYYIDSILKPKGPQKDFRNRRYTLYSKTGTNPRIPLLTEQKLNNPNAVRGQKIFFGSDLQKVSKETVEQEKVIKQADADRLNKINTPELQELISQIEENKKKERIEKATAKKLMTIAETPQPEDDEPRRSGRERTKHDYSKLAGKK